MQVRATIQKLWKFQTFRHLTCKVIFYWKHLPTCSLKRDSYSCCFHNPTQGQMNTQWSTEQFPNAEIRTIPGACDNSVGALHLAHLHESFQIVSRNIFNHFCTVIYFLLFLLNDAMTQNKYHIVHKWGTPYILVEGSVSQLGPANL